MFKSLKIMQESLRRHKEATDKICNTIDQYCGVEKLPKPLKLVQTSHQSHARPA